ncbi:hypothetical protein H8356DRAFT_1320773 [Neocallimastix lanati (nom. inval.)]|nr:hypothetical protein H8356DRAFT_1320773 [Neocallimastix sp. JGI-2020a]
MNEDKISDNNNNSISISDENSNKRQPINNSDKYLLNNCKSTIPAVIFENESLNNNGKKKIKYSTLYRKENINKNTKINIDSFDNGDKILWIEALNHEFNSLEKLNIYARVKNLRTGINIITPIEIF